MKHIHAINTCEVVSEQLVRDLETARKTGDDVDPYYGYHVELLKRDAVKLKNGIVELAGAARRGKRI